MCMNENQLELNISSYILEQVLIFSLFQFQTILYLIYYYITKWIKINLNVM